MTTTLAFALGLTLESPALGQDVSLSKRFETPTALIAVYIDPAPSIYWAEERLLQLRMENPGKLMIRARAGRTYGAGSANQWLWNFTLLGIRALNRFLATAYEKAEKSTEPLKKAVPDFACLGVVKREMLDCEMITEMPQ